MGNTSIRLGVFYPTPHIYASRSQIAFRKKYDCCEEAPCGRLPCKCCGKAMQRWFVKQCNSIFANQSNLQSISIVMAQHAMTNLNQEENSMRRVTRMVRDVIARAELNDRIWVGGVDVSRNTAEWSPGYYYWQYQAMMITTTITEGERKNLRACLKTTFSVPRPLVTLDIFNLKGIAAYAMKPDFNARHSYMSKTLRRNTHTSALKGAHLQQLSDQMSSVLHQDRLITIGFRRHGNLLVKLS